MAQAAPVNLKGRQATFHAQRLYLSSFAFIIPGPLFLAFFFIIFPRRVRYRFDRGRGRVHLRARGFFDTVNREAHWSELQAIEYCSEQSLNGVFLRLKTGPPVFWGVSNDVQADAATIAHQLRLPCEGRTLEAIVGAEAKRRRGFRILFAALIFAGGVLILGSTIFAVYLFL